MKSSRQQLKDKIMEQFQPHNWDWKTYVGLGILLLSINLFGPRGLIHWMVVHQQSERLVSLNAESSEKIAALEKGISNFKKYDYEQQKAIREELGYLKKDEWSLEFLEAGPNVPTKSR